MAPRVNPATVVNPTKGSGVPSHCSQWCQPCNSHQSHDRQWRPFPHSWCSHDGQWCLSRVRGRSHRSFQRQRHQPCHIDSHQSCKEQWCPPHSQWHQPCNSRQSHDRQWHPFPHGQCSHQSHNGVSPESGASRISPSIGSGFPPSMSPAMDSQWAVQ